jgi:hypothetical protein
MNLLQKLRGVRQWDAERAGFPGEHWLVLGAGLLVLRGASRSRGLVRRAAGRALGSALIARAASGHDGVAGKLARATEKAPAAGAARSARLRALR